MPLLDIKNLTLEIDTALGWVKALDKINLSIDSKEVRALVGESGSGKSLIVKSIVGALPDRWRVTADRMNWKGRDLLSMSDTQRRNITRNEMSVVLQNPTTTLDPSATLGEQIGESIPDSMLDKGWFWQRRAQRHTIAMQQLHKVGIRNHELCLSSYPHQLPDDVCQKFAIAMALVSDPKLLIADNPTMGMETTTKIQVLRLLAKLNKTRGLSILFVSHDLLAISAMADTMTVLYCGQTVESGRMSQIKRRPLHPYTQALLDSAPSFRRDLPPKAALSCLEGTIPTLQHLPIGCRLGPRCPRAQKDCVKMPAVRRIHDHHYACHFPLHRDKP
ncbi:peptide ABC transporter ATP-binding protein [Bowmanella dokdonensis]|uniref:ATP-binding cassette domain-containing protein n=1 Tax=Bowmanella dokdonensis TaxID=751969 RepID=A0A939DLE3_9ALTE|nr:oligopeptide/dipeptide ABC transporter ATP-binding protein [Bowmanella dokdonensis]MBN7824883.1 ATP-binding cassette domain-containing protein [Bowmanella dokdonensis]